ncbi:MAG: serine hydrolase domain-containing protein [Ilumatobacteraceae bacterium]
MAEIHGVCDERFGELKEILSRNIDSGDDVGASVAVIWKGELVADLWGGHADAERTKSWQSDTITNVWSSTKTQMALCALMLTCGMPPALCRSVATYWPEFAANGKEKVLVRHLLSHTSGVSGWEQPVTVDDLYDWEKSTAKLAAQAPWWEPGAHSGYHALNQGHLVGEVIRRITGKKLGEFFRTEVAEPLDLDFHIGLDPRHFSRVANVIPPPPIPIDMTTLDPNSIVVKTFTGPAPGAEESWTDEWRRADIGAANGHGNARSLAWSQSAISNGGVVKGRRLLSSSTIDNIFRVQADGPDPVLMVPVKFGIGYALPNESVPHLPLDRRVCYWGGWGGSSVVNDLDLGLTVVFVMNNMLAGLVGDHRGTSLVTAAFDAARN